MYAHPVTAYPVPWLGINKDLAGSSTASCLTSTSTNIYSEISNNAFSFLLLEGNRSTKWPVMSTACLLSQWGFPFVISWLSPFV